MSGISGGKGEGSEKWRERLSVILRLYLKTCRTCVLLTRLEFPLPDKQSIKVTYSLIAIGEFHAPSENEKTENWGLRCRLLSPFRAHLALCKKNNQKTTEPGACNASLPRSRFLDVTQGSPSFGGALRDIQTTAKQAKK